MGRRRAEWFPHVAGSVACFFQGSLSARYLLPSRARFISLNRASPEFVATDEIAQFARRRLNGLRQARSSSSDARGGNFPL